MNSKVAAANERKAANEAVNAEKERKRVEAADAAEWSKGSNARGQNRAEAAAAKADEAARKKREKEALLLAEEEGTSTVGKPQKDVGAGMARKQASKGRRKKKDDLSLLEDSLVSAADKKRRSAAQKEKERERRERERADERRREREEQGRSVDPLLANTNAMIGDDDGDGKRALVGREANVLAGRTAGESGLDGALRSLSVGGGGTSSSIPEDAHPEKRMKAMHKAFEERMMPQMKQDYPGLKMSQYKEKIFALWKKSKENPMNNTSDIGR